MAQTPESDHAVAALAEVGSLVPVKVQGSSQKAWMHRDTKLPRHSRGDALLAVRSADLGTWPCRAAVRIHYRIAIYVPQDKRAHGYYVLSFLRDQALVGRIDLKADRQAGVLRTHPSRSNLLRHPRRSSG